MNPPVVAIVGRPNVGKSTLFNSLARRRISIVEPTSGVTRDRISTVVAEPGAELELVDTGGMGVGDLDVLAEGVEEQIRYAVARADALVFVVDATDGIMPQDRKIADKLRTLNKPLVLVANKVESAKNAATAAEFYGLGLGEPMLVSALQKTNTGELRERLFALTAKMGGERSKPPEMRIAIVGRRNVGKSTFINALTKEKRVLVSELSGTTRDSVDVRVERDGKVFVAIDTAGVRKKRQVADSIEFYSQVRAEESVRRADVVLFMLDAQAKIARVDKKLGDYIREHHKPCIIVVNKWDLAKDLETGKYEKYISARLPVLSYAPICFMSALRSKQVQRSIEVARSLWKQARVRVPTPQLNDAIEWLKVHRRPAAKAGRRPKIYYGTQVGTGPPTIVLFVNSPKNFSSTYRRTISSFFREHLPFHEIPIVVRYKKATGPRG